MSGSGSAADSAASNGDGAPVYDKEVFDSVETGDVVLFNRRCSEMGSPLGIGVCLFAKWTSVYDHVGVVVRPPGEEPKVLEAGFRGVSCKPLQQRLDRVHHDSVAVRHLTLDGVDARATRARIEAFAKDVDGAPYKRRLTDFFTTALQPPEKRLASDVFSALNAAQRQEASLERLLKDPSASPHVLTSAKRRLAMIRGEIEVLQGSTVDHQDRMRRDLPQAAIGREPSSKAGFVCSELVGEAMQRAVVADVFPGPMNYGAHDWSSLAAYTTADEVRHRRPPALIPEANLGPERLLKKQAPQAPQRGDDATDAGSMGLLHALESLGWSFESAAEIKAAFKSVAMQRGEAIKLDGTQVVIPQSTRLWVSDAPAAAADAASPSQRDGKLQMLLPPGVSLGLAGPAAASSAASTEKKAKTQPPSESPLRTGIAESDGSVWVADAAACRAIAARVEAEQVSGRQQGGSVDTRTIQLRRAQAPEGCDKGDGRAAPFALYVVEKGAAHDTTVDRVYRQGEVIGLDAFLAHMPSSTLHGGWDGPVQSCRRVEPPRPFAVRDGTVLRRVAYGDILDANTTAAAAQPTSTSSEGDVVSTVLGAGKNLKELLAHYAVFHTYCDGRLQNHAQRPTLVDHMDLAHRHQYFDIPRLTLLATQLLDTILFQGREDNSLLFSDVLRVERAAENAARILKKKPGTIKKPDAQAALSFLGTQASHDGCTVSVTNINDVLHGLYRGRSDAPYISLAPAEPTGDSAVDDFLSDANRMSRRMIFAEMLDLCERGVIIVPLTVSADCTMLIRHIAVTCLGDESMRLPLDDGAGKNASAPSTAEPTPEQYFDEEMVKAIRGEVWDLSKRADAIAYFKRTASVIAIATLFNMALFPLQFISWHRMLFGRASRWTVRKTLSPSVLYDLITHTVHGIALRRVFVGTLLTGVGTVAFRPPEPTFDPYLDGLPTYSHWDAVRFGAKVCAAATLLTYPFEVAIAIGLHRSAEAATGANAINFHATQTTLYGALRTSYASHGLRGLFRGAHLAPFAATPFFGAHWLWYHEVLVPLFIDRRYAGSPLDGAPPSPDAWYARSSVAAALWKTGVVGWCYLAHTIVVHPIEAVRYTAMATQVPPRTAFASMAAGCGYNPTRLARRLYAGWATGILRAVPMMFGSFAVTGIAATNYQVALPDSMQRRIKSFTSY